MKCYPAMLMNAVSRFYGADPEPAAGRGGDAAFSGVSRGGAPWATSAVLGVRRAPGPPSSPLLPSPLPEGTAAPSPAHARASVWLRPHGAVSSPRAPRVWVPRVWAPGPSVSAPPSRRRQRPAR